MATDVSPPNVVCIYQEGRYMYHQGIGSKNHAASLVHHLHVLRGKWQHSVMSIGTFVSSYEIASTN